MRFRPWLLVVIALGLVVLGSVGWFFFAPKGAEVRDDAMPESATTIRQGDWTGADEFHFAHGRVKLLEGQEGGQTLRFEDYDARDGPAVYFYLLPEGVDPAEVEEKGVRIASAELEGTFNLAVPEGVDATRFASVVAWCDSFDVLFGSAPLSPV